MRARVKVEGEGASAHWQIKERNGPNRNDAALRIEATRQLHHAWSVQHCH